MHIAHQWLGERSREDDVAQRQALTARFEVNHNVDVGQRAPHRRFDVVGDPLALDGGLAGRDRDNGIGEVVPTGLPHA